MEIIGKFEFNRKDLIGHGAFAVVFKGRHKQRHDLEVAVKCINKRNLAKSQSLLGKEIKILKELRHENIVGLLDFQEISGSVYLIMEYCNGGDLAEYLHCKGSLSEDTIRSFVQQIAGAMSVLRSKGIIHRDLKPQNILLSYSTGRRICIKLADFGFARYLQGNTMAATLCGSPMYMAPEVIMSHNYDAKADLWSVGTIIFQCLTGKAPFQASTPQELRLFYERNRNLSPNIPRETSSHLRQLLLGLLQRNHRDRMDFNEFFHHPFLEASSAARKSSPVPMPSYPSSGSGSSSSGSSASHLTPTQSETEPQTPRPRCKATPPSDSQLKDSSSFEMEDFIVVPAQFPSEMGDHASPDIGMQSGPAECCGSSYSQSVPVPVPTQVHNYQRMEQNLQGASRTALPIGHCCTGDFPGCGRRGSLRDSPRGSPECGPCPSRRRLSTGGYRPHPPSPRVGTIPESPDHAEPQGSRTGLQDVHSPQQHQVFPLFSDIGAIETSSTPKQRWHRHSPDAIVHRWELGRGTSRPQTLSRTRTMPDLQESIVTQNKLPERRRSSVKRSSSVGRLSDKLLKAVVESQVDRGSCESPNPERPMDITAPSGGPGTVDKGSGSPAHELFSLDSPPHGHTCPLNTRRFSAPSAGIGAVDKASESPAHALFTLDSPPHVHTPPLNPRRFSVGSCCPGWTCGRFHKAYNYGYPDSVASNLQDTVFVPPELPEETLMEQGHTEMVAQLRFTLTFSHCVMEMAAAKDSGTERSETSDASFLEQSQVADQISQLSREWSCAEQLVLYMKCAELLSSALHTAMEAIKQDKLYPSVSVKQVVRRLNELYKECVMSCRSLTVRLQLFFSTKQRLMDRFSNITAEKIIYSHTIQMVQAAALDEMFHHGEASVQRYQKALLLMEGLSLIITEKSALNNINKCKQCIERRLSSLQPAS